MTLLHHIPNLARWFLKTISSHKYEERRIEVYDKEVMICIFHITCHIDPRPILALGPSALWLIWKSRVDMTCDMKNAI